MRDIPKRCWYCEQELAIESIRVECAHCGADVARAYEWLDALDAARAEAERLKADLAAAHAVIEAARRVVNNEYDADPADVHDLAEALKRYDERMMAARGEGTD